MKEKLAFINRGKAFTTSLILAQGVRSARIFHGTGCFGNTWSDGRGSG